MGIGYDVELIPLEEIYSDEKFNCRQDVINRIDVLSLMESIHAGRLENPIVVQPLAEIVVVTPPPDGAKFRALNGNRRFAAFRFLAKDFPGEVRYKAIPAIVRCGLDDDTARALNISDNLEHKDLNLLQESKSLEKWFRAGYTRDTVARMLKQSSSWVQIRYNLLDLPVDLQEYAAKGLIGQGDVKDLYQYRKDLDKLYARAKEIISHRLKGSKAPRVRSKRQQARATKPGRARARGEIEEMIAHVADNIGFGLVTRLMAWSAGNVSTFEIMAEIKKTAAELGNTYKPLDEEVLEHL